MAKPPDAQPHAPKVLAVTSGKGGVGKTFIAVHLAAQAARQGKRTLLLDADLGLANVDIMLGITARGTVADVLRGEASMDDIIVPYGSHLDVLPGGSGLCELTRLDAGQQVALLSELEAIAPRYDIAIIDSAAGIGDNVMYFVSSAQAALVVLTPDPTSLTDAYALIKVLSRHRDMRRFMVLVNQAEDLDAQITFRRLLSVADRYLDVYLEYVGHLPPDRRVAQFIRRQQLLPAGSPFADHLSAVLDAVLDKPVHERREGGLKLFWQHSLRAGISNHTATGH